ncbi:aKG-HExxH-type peptide beta-hydroxylase [Streptomyces milbemycinicus]|uniref:AKG-HExxH-type peptide beta-hydroxylase n=1 Tax=Streptomyces milbemycinicus TaxID=476552 RepID=A0ABW8LJ55_9ACTN
MLISTHGLPAVLETLSVLIASDGISPDSAPANAAAGRLAWSWQQYMRRREPAVPVLDADLGVLPVHIGATPQGQALLDAFHRACLVDSVSYEPPRYAAGDEDRLNRSSDQISAALDGLAADWPQVRTLYGVLLPVVVLAPSCGLAGGTASSLPGVLWASVTPAWTPTDVQEFLLHELVHTTLFLEERRHGFYRDMRLLLDEENLTPSAIRTDRRPLDKVFHSIVVATEILQARIRLGTVHHPEDSLHPDSETLRANTLTSIRAVQKLDMEKLLMPRPIEMIEKCRTHLEQIVLCP